MSPSKHENRLRRLKSRTTIDALFLSGKTVHTQRLTVRYILQDKPDTIHVGVSVAKRNFNRAVDRNRIKRQLRVAVKAAEKQLTHHGSYMLLYTGRNLPKTDQLISECNSLFALIDTPKTP